MLVSRARYLAQVSEKGKRGQYLRGRRRGRLQEGLQLAVIRSRLKGEIPLS